MAKSNPTIPPGRIFSRLRHKRLRLWCPATVSSPANSTSTTTDVVHVTVQTQMLACRENRPTVAPSRSISCAAKCGNVGQPDDNRTNPPDGRGWKNQIINFANIRCMSVALFGVNLFVTASCQCQPATKHKEESAESSSRHHRPPSGAILGSVDRTKQDVCDKEGQLLFQEKSVCQTLQSRACSFDFLISFLVPAACSRTTRLGSCLINQTLQGRHSIGRLMRTQLQGRGASAAPRVARWRVEMSHFGV